MKLAEVVKGIDCKINGSTKIDIKGIAYNSKKVMRGYIFIALSGQHYQGSEFINEAIKNGANAVVTDQDIKYSKISTIVVSDTRKTLAEIALNFYKHPDKTMNLVGITGTNGKTTITYFLETILKKARRMPGVIGTINYRYGKQIINATNTTPESADLIKMLYEMKKANIETAVLEVSSHALELERVSGIEFDIAIFTNLTQDHLDFHGNLNSYFEAKSKLFMYLKSTKKNNSKFAIINSDDEYGRKLIEKIRYAEIITYGVDKKADVRGKIINLSSKGSEFAVETSSGKSKVNLHHVGMHNVYNALASIAAAIAMGISLKTAVKALEKDIVVPGRLEKVNLGQPFSVVVDYAHTDDALRNVLLALKRLNPYRLITVFGCGGDRDRSKRPLMGKVASELSDFVLVTSDNPRSEDPKKIALDIEVGIRREKRNNYHVLLDREQAIAQAINMSRKGDIVLIAGKGHEDYQIIGGQKHHFNDKEIAVKYIKQLIK